MARAATAVAELIRSKVGAGRAHVVGFSLGAQVGLQLLRPTRNSSTARC